MKYYFSAGKKSVSTIEQYAVDGERVSFREVVSHKNKAGETVSSSAMGIYQIRNGKISRAWYFID
jgi:predicted ester cyclase